MNEQQYSQARTFGEQARRAGKSRDTNPYRGGSTVQLRGLRDAWSDGWNSADVERRAKR